MAPLGHMFPMEMGPGMWAAMFILPLLVVGALVWFGVSLARRLMDRGRTGPRQILEKRFARGEIDEDEFQRRDRILREADARVD
jgi:uncharacterized membrane protein